MLSRLILRRLVVVLLALFVVNPVGAAAPTSSITSHEIASPVLGRSLPYNLYLPPSYDPAGSTLYPVLYLLHGNAGNFRDWATNGRIQATADALIARGEIPPCIIVMPGVGNTWYVDRAEKIESALIQDFIPGIEKTVRAKGTREGRFIGGLSMGGYGSMRFALKYPEMFAAAALLSPSIYNPEPPSSSSARTSGMYGSSGFDAAVWKADNYPAFWDAYLGKKLPVRLYLVSGDDDAHFIEAEVTQFYELLRRNRQPAELRIVDGGHTWAVWAGTIGDAMKYLFKAPATAAPAR